LLMIIGIVLLVALIGLWIGLSVANSNADKNQLLIDNLQESFTTWSSLDDKTSAQAQDSFNSLVAELNTLAAKGGSAYPVVKAQYLLGLAYYAQEDYEKSRTYFLEAANKGKGTYMESLSIMNAAAVSEQLGDNAKALEYYQSVWDTFGSSAAEAPKALFSVARLHESNGNTTLAKAVFQQLADEFPTSEYAKLAQTRLVILQ
jgi:TolA-binding protein